MLKGLGNLANLGSILKQAQEMGGKMQGLAEELKGRRASGNSGGGLVQVDVNGLGEVLSCRIDPSLVTGGDRELLEDLLPAAVNQALSRAKELHTQAMQSLAQGVDMPGLGEMLAGLSGGQPDEDKSADK